LNILYFLIIHLNSTIFYKMSVETFTIYNVFTNERQNIEDIANKTREQISEIFKDRLRYLNWERNNTVIMGSMGTIVKFIDDDNIDYFSEM
jgi:hypothetical protein